MVAWDFQGRGLKTNKKKLKGVRFQKVRGSQSAPHPKMKPLLNHVYFTVSTVGICSTP